jgi:putative CocE/NonD family hydrolase
LNPWRLVGCLIALMVSSSAWTDEDKRPAPSLPAKVSGFADAGDFHLYLNEEVLARIHFTWKEDGTFANQSVLEYAGQKLAMNVAITPDKDGRWTTIEGTGRSGEKYRLERNQDKVKQILGKKTSILDLKSGAVLFENFSPALMTLCVRAYDAARGGKQTLPMVVIPSAQIDATLERLDTIERSVVGKDLKLTRYDLAIGSVHLTVWADAGGKIYLAEVPSQQAAYVREGYETLRRPEIQDPLLSQPNWKVRVESNVRVAMRDGVKLSTDLYRPEKKGEGNLTRPVILVRTPYKKEVQGITGMYYARRGYVVAIQDCRGRFASEGTWEPFVHEARDGYDTIEWLAAQPWCTGKVGMIGGSYVGWVQWWAASERPPHLVTIIPNVSPPDPFYNIPYEYGTFFLWGAIWWADVLETGATADVSGEKMRRSFEKKYHQLLKKLPVIELDKVVLGKENTYWRTWIEHPSEDAYWHKTSFHHRLGQVDIPVFHQSGWFDGDGIGSKLNYLRMVSLGHGNQKLVLGPWGHTDVAARTHGSHDFGPQAMYDLPRDYVRWFDYWLKGIDNSVAREPLVRLFVMNSNRWLEGPRYPLPQTRFEKWYLASAGKANTSGGDGKLTRDVPPAESATDHYRYDPADPTPNPDFLEGDEDKPDADARNKEKRPDRDRREEVLKSRRDILVYVSEPCTEPYTFAGPVSAVLYAATSARDTDWFMRLATIDARGKAFPLVAGTIRARFRESMAKPVLLEPGKVYAYSLDLWQTGITVPKGHRLRVEVASASFPLYSRNLNTGGHNEKDTQYVSAEQTIYHSAEYPSHILLPMIPEERRDRQKE